MQTGHEFSKRETTMDITGMVSLKHWGERPSQAKPCANMNRQVDCGWGNLIFSQTFNKDTQLTEVLRDETHGQRNIALYVRNPQVLVAQYPQELFLDPSLTYRLDLSASIRPDITKGLIIEPAAVADEYAINRIYKSRHMIPVREGYLSGLDANDSVVMLVARETGNGDIVGVITGVDHQQAFNDPDNGSSLWALATDSQTSWSGLGKALIQALAAHFKSQGRSFMDLSVMHDNHQAIALYEHLGFKAIPVYCIKNRNAVNEKLYTGQQPPQTLNIYARIIIEEACRRGIAVDIQDAEQSFFSLSLGGRTIHCRESLTDLTSAVAMSLCSDKAVTHRVLNQVGLSVPEQIAPKNNGDLLDFLHQHQRLVIKPANGEQGDHVFVDLSDEGSVLDAWKQVCSTGDTAIVEEFVKGQDLRIVVINYQVVAASIRIPARITGNGLDDIKTLIEKQSHRRSKATGGESYIPLDSETLRCIADAGFSLGDTLPCGQTLTVRKTANLHTGGTMTDVTQKLHPQLADAAEKAAKALNIPVVGLDMMVDAPDKPAYHIIEANERPGLANHEPQPTAEKLIDLLFPQTQPS